MSSKYTKGEWKVFNLTDVFTDTDSLGKGDMQICDCNVHKVILSTDKELPLEEAEANARLIACAPKLLAACKKYLDWFDKISRYQNQRLGHGLEEAERNWNEAASIEPYDCTAMRTAVANAEK